jgi:hypothetical protein
MYVFENLYMYITLFVFKWKMVCKDTYQFTKYMLVITSEQESRMW